MIEKLVENIQSNCTKWHENDLKWFYPSEEFDISSLEGLTAKLAFHNYNIWHFIEGYQDPETGKVNFVYLGGLEHNRYRNDTIEMIDDIFIKSHQKGGGPYNSETIGSILDRISNSYIKMMHLKEEGNLDKLESIESGFNFLINCAVELYSDMLNGNRQIINFKRFKTSGYDKKD